MHPHERPAMPAVPLSNSCIEGEINDTLRRLNGLDELFRAYRETGNHGGVSERQAEILVTLISDIKSGAQRTLDLFNAGHRD